ncbi:hypothetical protein GWI33_006152 [Rhynchophorus ferrugineus]|uniref:Mos1 transposase HTH domain-containing protein n=1 Tax=Rhynchophorus ferrugineus TaxID=354439 RepID=A0A834IKW5_RHYFE|nr:hypothetical protein GWI33_006152 [Rhynchophorus ferrugineus]
MDKKEFRVLIKYCFLKGKNKVEAQTWLDVEFPDTAPENQPSKIGYAKFKRGEISTDDSERSECPKKVFTDENINKIHKMILNDRKLKLN